MVYLRGQFGTSDLPKLKRMTSKHLIIIIITIIITTTYLVPGLTSNLDACTMPQSPHGVAEILVIIN